MHGWCRGSKAYEKVIDGTEVAGMPAVIPEVSGPAHICGFSTWVLDDREPLEHGFLVR